MTLKTEIYNFVFMPGTNYAGWPALGFHIAWISALLGAMLGDVIFHYGWSPLEYSFYAMFYGVMGYLVLVGIIILALACWYGDDA